MLDARHLNSNTTQSSEYWPLELLETQLTNTNTKLKSAKNLLYAYAHAAIDDETFNIIEFSWVDKLFAFIGGS